MEQGAAVLRFIVAAGFLVLGIAAVWASIRPAGRRQRALGAALGLLGILPTLSFAGELAPSPWRAVASRAGIAVFVASGYALLLFRHRLIPLRRGAASTIGVVAAATAAAALLLNLSADGPHTAAQTASGLSLSVVWLACVGEPIVRFWRSAKQRPAIQRARLRALAGGYSGIVVVALTAQPSTHHPTLLLAAQVIVMVAIPALWVAVMPPAWLRRSWQARDEIARVSLDLLVRHREGVESLAAHGLLSARAMVGGDGGAIITATGRAVATEGIDKRAVIALAATTPAHPAIVEWGDGAAIVVPLQLDEGTGRLIVMSGPFSPLFGRHELDQTARFAATLAIAIDRVRLADQHQTQSEHYAGVVRALDDLGEGFMVTDGKRLVHANDAYCRLTGYTLDELCALPSLMDLAPPDERERVNARRRARLDGGVAVDHFESALIRKDGRRVELEVSMKILGSPTCPSIVCLIRDVTHRRRAEDRLRSALDREHEAVRRLEAVDEMKNAFLSAVSHELRTPLTGIFGFARTLQTLGASLSEEDRTIVLDRLTSNAVKLDRLLSDLLDLDRLARGIIEPQRRPVDVGSLTRAVVREFKASSDRRIVLDVDSVIAEIDRAHIERVVENLLANAARHTADGTTIWVRVHGDADGVTIAVEDAGPGVPDDVRDVIFEPFRQGPSLRAHSPGVGIGLSLVRRFVDLHGGTVDVGGRNGGGASFRVSLPTVAPASPTSPAHAAPPPPARRTPHARRAG